MNPNLGLDPRPVHVRLVKIGRRTHFVTVLPPGPAPVGADVVWTKPKAGAHHAMLRMVSLLDGIPEWHSSAE